MLDSDDWGHVFKLIVQPSNSLSDLESFSQANLLHKAAVDKIIPCMLL